MAQAERRLLAREARAAGCRQLARQLLQLLGLTAPGQRAFQLVGAVEVVLDDRLVAARHEHEVLDARRECLVHDVLDHGAVDDGEHFLRHGLGRRQETRTQSRDREYRLSDRFTLAGHSDLRSFWPAYRDQPARGMPWKRR